jgi:hypothetical protein
MNKNYIYIKGGSNGKLPLRTCPECSVPEPYRSPDWALVPAKLAEGLNSTTTTTTTTTITTTNNNNILKRINLRCLGCIVTETARIPEQSKNCQMT